MEDKNLILDKYKQIVAALIGKNVDSIFIEVQNNSKEWVPICEDYYNKKEVELSWCLGDYQVRWNTTVIATWKLYQLQHCCAFAVSCQANVNTPYRNKGVGKIMNNLRQDICRYLNYSSLLCTDIEKNEYQRKVLKANGWKDIHNVINKRTQNRVYLSVINL